MPTRSVTSAKGPKPRNEPKRSAVKSAPVAARKVTRSRYLAQAAVTSKFLSICRDAISDQSRVYVKDKAGKYYLTLDPVERNIAGPVVDVSAQYFKDNFSRFSSLIKDGLHFRLSKRGSSDVIYARRHTKYQDPLDHIIDRWRDLVVEAASTKEQEEKLLRAIRAITNQEDSQTEFVLKELRQLKLGIARLGIGHRPFEEGQLPDNNRGPDDEDEPH